MPLKPSNSLEEKKAELKAFFAEAPSLEITYQKIIDLGRSNPKLADEFKIEKNLVPGCQSVMYLRVYQKEGKLFFEAESDALISSGLAAILCYIYSGETPEVILKAEPAFLNELNIAQSLSPNRANGLYSVFLKIKQLALYFMIGPQGS